LKVIVKGGKRWKRLTVEIPPEVEGRLRKLANDYGFTLVDVLKILLKGDFLENREGIRREDVDELQRKVFSLERELYELEGKWSPLKFKAYYLALDNRNLSIQLAAIIAQNKRLRKKLGLPKRDYSEIEGKIHYYLSFDKSGGEPSSE